jgi:hypothetical protein
MTTQPPFAEALSEADFGPVRIEVEKLEPPGGPDALLILLWEDDAVPFVAEFKNARDLRTLRSAVLQARRWAEGTGREPLVVVPYLNDDWLAFLRSERMSGIDLSGNGRIHVPGRWSWFQRGIPNRFPEPTRARAPYRGKSALVGRVLLSRPHFEAVGEIQDEIELRGGSLSLGQVSKVLSALERDLIVRKGNDGVRLLQPARLLDSLAEGYRRPAAVQETAVKATLDRDLFVVLAKRAGAAGARTAGYQPARYVIAPEEADRLVVFVEPHGFADVARAVRAERSRRFANLTIRAIREPWVFFDAEEESDFKWCSPLETYLQLMQGGKREQEAALQLREDILGNAAATR